MEVRSIETIAHILNEAEIRYLVVGGLAVNAHGYERFTNDLDLVIALDPVNISGAMASLLKIGYHPVVPITAEEFSNPENRKFWKREKNMLVLKFWSDSHQRTPIDIFIDEPFDFDVEWERALQVPVSESASIPVLSRESLIAMKTEAGREKDLLDVQMLRKLDSYR
jgi:hypothetical protein